MRRKDREIKDPKEIHNILNNSKVCRIGMYDGENVYIVPMNYGYIFDKENIVMYFHSASQGRKIDIMNNHKKVCVEIDSDHSLVYSDIACENTYKYSSLIGNGIVDFIEDIEEKKTAVNAIMMHQTGSSFDISNESVKNLCVFKIVISELSGKSNIKT